MKYRNENNHSLADVKAWIEAIAESVEHKLPAGLPDIEASNRRTTRRLGTAFGHDKDRRHSPRGRITIYAKMLHELDYHEDAIADVVLHELAHCLEWQLYGTMSHGPKWKAACRNLGAYPRATSSEQERIAWATSQR